MKWIKYFFIGTFSFFIWIIPIAGTYLVLSESRYEGKIILFGKVAFVLMAVFYVAASISLLSRRSKWDNYLFAFIVLFLILILLFH